MMIIISVITTLSSLKPYDQILKENLLNVKAEELENLTLVIENCLTVKANYNA